VRDGERAVDMQAGEIIINYFTYHVARTILQLKYTGVLYPPFPDGADTVGRMVTVTVTVGSCADGS
jgi:hypothetical protein